MAIISLLPISASAQAGTIFFLYADIHRNDTIGLKDFKIMDGDQNMDSGGLGNYKFHIISYEKKTLFESKFQQSFVTYRESIGEDGNMRGEEVTLDTVSKFIRLPYFKEAKTIELYHEDDLIFSLEVADYVCNHNAVCNTYENNLNCPDDCKIQKVIQCGDSKCEAGETCTNCSKDCGECKVESKCGNGVCNSDENYLKCPSDCSSGSTDGYCDSIKDRICDKDCAGNKDPDCVEKKSDLVYYIIVMIILLVLLVIIYSRRKSAS